MKLYIKLFMVLCLTRGWGLYAAEFDPLGDTRRVVNQAKQIKDFRNLPEDEKIALDMELQTATRDVELPGNSFVMELQAAMLDLLGLPVNSFVEEGPDETDLEEHDDHLKDVTWHNTLIGTIDTPLKIDKKFVESCVGKETVDAVESYGVKVPPEIGIKFGLYKGDVAEGSFFVGDAAADYWLYTRLAKGRAEHIFKLIKDDYNGFLRALEESLVKEADHEQAQYQKGGQPSNDYYVRTACCAPLKKYISEKHHLLGTFPLNKHVLLPLALRFGWDKVSQALKERYTIKPPSPFTSVGWLLGKKQYAEALLTDRLAFSGDKAFENIPPISLSRCIKPVFNFFYPSSTWFGDSFREGSVTALEFLNSLVGCYIPNFFFSNPLCLNAYKFLGMGFSAKCFDETMVGRWAEYAVKNRKELKIRLMKYRDCVNSKSATAQEDLIRAEKAVRELVEEGNRLTSWFPLSLVQQWRNFRNSGSNKIPLITGAWVSAVSTLKGLKEVVTWWSQR